MFLKLTLSVLIIIFSLTFNLCSYNRAIIISPAVSDIFLKLHLEDKVVGVTKHIKGFKNAVKVGTHIKPNLEIIKSLNPDIIIISSYRFFPKDFVNKFNARIYVYNPYTLKQILDNILEIGKLFNKEKESQQLIAKLKEKLLQVKNLKYHPKVVYEIMQNPYILAGQKNIISDIIKTAGGKNIININKKLVKFSQEKVRFLNPDIYIYQVGPMNKNPLNPLKRVWFKGCKFKVLKVNEINFARPNTQSFDNVLFLNKFFYKIFNEKN